MPMCPDTKHMRNADPAAAEMLRVRRRLALLATYAMLATAVVNLAPTTGASAAAGYNEVHLVARVIDGDTIEVYPPGQTSGTREVVRFVGVNTNETGTCHAGAATNRLKNLVEGDWVTLKAEDAGSRAMDGRSLRFVEHNGVDLSLLMIEESRGFVMRSDQEPSRNEQYALASHHASVAGKRIWDPAFCGAGPRQSAALRMIVNWDAPGVDGSPGTYNGEWFRVFNDDATALSVGGWTIRDSSTQGIFVLPAGTRIPANGFLTVYVGSGSNTATKVYLGLERNLFSNALGDAGFLVDPDGDIRVHFAYPCVVDCFDELQGALDMSANADAEGGDNANPNGEWVNITNTSNASFNLYGYLLRSGAKSYAFPSNSLVHPGERLRVHIGSGNDSRLTKYWGRPDGILSNSGPEFVEVVTYDDIEIGRFAWPCNPCGPTPDVVIHDYRWEGGPSADSPNDEWIEIKNDGP
jgi:endonuclease YncB( thermonuclease family)